MITVSSVDTQMTKASKTHLQLVQSAECEYVYQKFSFWLNEIYVDIATQTYIHTQLQSHV